MVSQLIDFPPGECPFPPERHFNTNQSMGRFTKVKNTTLSTWRLQRLSFHLINPLSSTQLLAQPRSTWPQATYFSTTCPDQTEECVILKNYSLLLLPYPLGKTDQAESLQECHHDKIIIKKPQLNIRQRERVSFENM